MNYHVVIWIFCAAPILNTHTDRPHSKIVSEYDQEIPQSQTADHPVAPRGGAAQYLKLKPTVCISMWIFADIRVVDKLGTHFTIQ